MKLPIVGEVETGTFWKVTGIVAAVVIVVAAVAFAVYRTIAGPPAPELDRSPKLAGQYVENQGRLHLDPGQVFNDYNSNPPTSGPHDPRVPQFRIYNDPLPKEQLVHAMEHGGVVVWHNCTQSPACPGVIDQLKEIVRDGLRNDKNLVMVPYPDMEQDTIALTAWTRLDKFPVADFTPERVQRFIKDHEKRFNPEHVP
jgi:hypothetical protein